MADGIAIVMKVPWVKCYQSVEDSTKDTIQKYTGERKSEGNGKHLSPLLLISSPPYFLSTYRHHNHRHHCQLQLALMPTASQCIKRPVISPSFWPLARQNPLILHFHIFTLQIFSWWVAYSEGSGRLGSRPAINYPLQDGEWACWALSCWIKSCIMYWALKPSYTQI